MTRSDNADIWKTARVEWYTPPIYTEYARSVLGGIDLDPASTNMANIHVKATRFYTKQDDGMKQDWKGTVWLNPPWNNCRGWVLKLLRHYQAGDITAAILCLPAGGITADYFQPLHNFPMCVPNHRVAYIMPGKLTGDAVSGTVFVYVGPRQKWELFARTFSTFGPVRMGAWRPGDAP